MEILLLDSLLYLAFSVVTCLHKLIANPKSAQQWKKEGSYNLKAAKTPFPCVKYTYSHVTIPSNIFCMPSNVFEKSKFPDQDKEKVSSKLFEFSFLPVENAR